MIVTRYGSNNLTIEQMHSSRAEAIAAGHSHFFTGKPCKHGHIEIRSVKNSVCLACRQVYYLKNREKILQSMKKYAETNKDKIKKRKRQHFQANRGKYRESGREWSEDNKEKLAAYKKEYRENNKEKISAYQKKYREDNKEKLIAYRKKNREKIYAYNRKRYHELKDQL